VRRHLQHRAGSRRAVDRVARRSRPCVQSAGYHCFCGQSEKWKSSQPAARRTRLRRAEKLDAVILRWPDRTPRRATSMPEPHATESAPPSRFAKLRWILALAFLGLTAWLQYREVGELPLPDVQRTLLDVPTLPALGVAALALISVAFTGFVDVL